MRPDIIIEHTSGLHLFFGETPEGRKWLQNHATPQPFERIGRSLTVEDEHLARDLADAAIADGLDVLE